MGSSKLHHTFPETSPTPHHLAKLWMRLSLSRNPTLTPEAAAKSIFIQLPQMFTLRHFPCHSNEQSEHRNILLPSPDHPPRQSCALLLHILGWEMSAHLQILTPASTPTVLHHKIQLCVSIWDGQAWKDCTGDSEERVRAAPLVPCRLQVPSWYFIYYLPLLSNAPQEMLLPSLTAQQWRAKDKVLGAACLILNYQQVIKLFKLFPFSLHSKWEVKLLAWTNPTWLKNITRDGTATQPPHHSPQQQVLSAAVILSRLWFLWKTLDMVQTLPVGTGHCSYAC